MTSAPPPAGRARADEVITADRRETKYRVDRARAPAFVRALAAELTPHRFTGEGSSRLPDAHHFVTTVYFDTAAHTLLRAAHANAEQNVKLRARAYYDLHPALAELATDRAQIVHDQPWVWFELKRRREGRSQKVRFRLDKREIEPFFRGAHPAFPDAATPELSAIVETCRSLSAPLVPSCIVGYRRIAFQDAGALLRITVDLEVAFYAVPADLWQRPNALVRGTFGAPAAVEPCVLVEVKRLGETPPWLARALERAGAEAASYSKFARAGQVVHGSV